MNPVMQAIPMLRLHLAIFGLQAVVLALQIVLVKINHGQGIHLRKLTMEFNGKDKENGPDQRS